MGDTTTKYKGNVSSVDVRVRFFSNLFLLAERILLPVNIDARVHTDTLARRCACLCEYWYLDIKPMRLA